MAEGRSLCDFSEMVVAQRGVDLKGEHKTFIG